MAKITQQDETFGGISLMATGLTSAGTEKIKLEIDKHGIKKVRISRPDARWGDAKGEINSLPPLNLYVEGYSWINSSKMCLCRSWRSAVC
jgi:hypothetical protein